MTRATWEAICAVAMPAAVLIAQVLLRSLPSAPLLTPSICAKPYLGAMKGLKRNLPPVDFDKGVILSDAASADRWGRKQGADAELSTSRLSITSFAVSFGIVAWALVNAYLAQG